MPIQTAQYKIRHLRRHEIEQLLQLCKSEGRHMGTVAEVETWMQIDPHGFFVAINQEGRIIGSCCGMRLSAAHGYVGMYVVDKDYRGLGIGKQVWDAALKHLGSRNNGLSAVAHLFTLYRDKAGFSQVAEWTVDLYKLDNMALVFRCKQHHVWYQVRRKKVSCKLLEYYRNNTEPTCQENNQCDGASLASILENECNVFCFIQERKNKERKCLKQRKSSKSLEISDDESYGFSSLFFEDQSNEEISDIEDESLGPIESIGSPAGVVESKPRDNMSAEDLIEYGLKRRSYCDSCQLNSGKMRTMMVGGDNIMLVEQVVDYDRQLHSYDRAQLVRLTLSERNCISRVAMLGQAVVGYGCVKPNLQNMWIISPLYADNEFVARLLLLDLITDLIFYQQYHWKDVPESAIVLKCPSNNHHAAKLLEKMGFVKQDYSLRRCYTKQVFQVPTQAIYALHTSVFCTE